MPEDALDPVTGFLYLLIAAVLGYFVFDYFRYHFPNHLVRIVYWQVKRTYPDDLPGIFLDFLNDHYEQKSTIGQIRNAVEFLVGFKNLDVPPCVNRQEVDQDKDA